MIELITAIALLCQVSTGARMYLREVTRHQLQCQQEYLKCISKFKDIRESRVIDSKVYGLSKCILEKK